MGMAFPRGTIILSDGMPRDQRIAASLINNFVNYSISISLGIADTVIGRRIAEGAMCSGVIERVVFAIGVDGFGMGIALYFLWISVVKGKTIS
jgi:hypothetical protein